MRINGELIDLLTDWPRSNQPNSMEKVLPEKLSAPPIIKKFPAVYGNRKCIAAYVRARHLCISRATWIAPILFHHDSVKYISILSLLIYPYIFQTLSFFQVYSQKFWMDFSSSPLVPLTSSSVISLSHLWLVRIASYYAPNHTSLAFLLLFPSTHVYVLFSILCSRRSFVTVKSNRNSCISVY
jgi:hypothetical protein